MKILKLSNSLIILLFFSFLIIITTKSLSNEPEDIWSIDKQDSEKISDSNDDNLNQNLENLIDIENNSINQNEIIKDEELTNKIFLAGLYDPEDNDLSINMWSNSNGDDIKSLFNKIYKLNLSNDAKKILDIALLTNSYVPTNNIFIDEFLEIKSKYLIKNNNLNLIKNYIIRNQDAPGNSSLIIYYLNQHLSYSNLDEACSLFDEIKSANDDKYIAKFKIYCLINDNRKEEAQLNFDLINEIGFEDKFYENKFNFLMGYDESENIMNETSDKNILNFHLSHRVNKNFSYDPNENTSKIIWKYLSTSNLLESIDLVNLEDEAKIKIIEKATHEKNYPEEELFDLYKRFQFNINQLLTVKDTYKILSGTQGRAILYQRMLLTVDVEEKLFLASKLKESFINDNISNAFSSELSKTLKSIEIEKVPSNYSTFYNNNIISNTYEQKKIKFNNKIIHQSKLLNYFLNKTALEKVEKDTNELLKKIKRDKDYFFSIKDAMLIDSLRSDGIKISKKYENLYVSNPDIPVDIQVLMSNDETGMILLRLVEILGEDKLETLGPESLNVIISVLNQINLDKLRNQILIEVLPLKV